jgi:hypothetical protein
MKAKKHFAPSSPRKHAVLTQDQVLMHIAESLDSNPGLEGITYSKEKDPNDPEALNLYRECGGKKSVITAVTVKDRTVTCPRPVMQASGQDLLFFGWCNFVHHDGKLMSYYRS